MDDDDLDTQWTGPARDRLQEAAEALANELRSHVEALSQMTGCHQDDERLFSANRALAQALRTYNEATFDWSGTFPIGLVN
ncbi:MAG: hypothetical protein ACTHK4_00430, partial [Mycobacteriales bacterium]